MQEKNAEYNPLREALNENPLFFEPIAPFRRSTPVQVEERARDIAERLRSVRRLDAVNVPEIIEENHKGRPFYRNGDIRQFVRIVGEGVGRETITTKVVAHMQSVVDFRNWLEETKEMGIRNTILVGGNRHSISYPGPRVTEATRIAKEFLEQHGGLVGNITIPQRQNEAEKMLNKTVAGADFFTSQMLFEPDGVHIDRLVEYDRLCKSARVKPAAVLLSFTPITEVEDVGFSRWLDAEISEETEKLLLNTNSQPPKVKSTENALRIWKNVSEKLSEARASVSLGVNVEQISQHNLEASIEMLDSFAKILPRRS